MKEIKVVAAIIQKENKILATKRGYGEFINMWEFPGGKIESGETKEQALVREIKEELNIKSASSWYGNMFFASPLFTDCHIFNVCIALYPLN